MVPSGRRALAKKLLMKFAVVMKSHGFRGLKLVHTVVGLGSYQLLTTINEPAMYPIVAAAADLGMVILAHSTPEECAGILDAVPNARILMAHSGGCPTALGDWFRAIEVAKQLS